MMRFTRRALVTGCALAIGVTLAVPSARVAADTAATSAATQVTTVSDETFGIVPPSMAVAAQPCDALEVVNGCEIANAVVTDSPTITSVPGFGIVAGTTLVNVPETVSTTYSNDAGQTVASTTTTAYNDTFIVSAGGTPPLPTLVAADANLPPCPECPAGLAPSGGSSNSFPCAYDQVDSRVIPYNTVHSSGAGDHGSYGSFVISPYGLNEARRVTPSSGPSYWTWQIEACAQGNVTPGTHDTVERGGVSVAITTSPNSMLGVGGLNGNTTSSQSSEYGFNAEVNHDGLAASVNSKTTNVTYGLNQSIMGPNNRVKAPADSFSSNEMSSYWDNNGGSAAPTAVSTIGQVLWEFNVSDSSTKYIEADTYMQLYCPNNCPL